MKNTINKENYIVYNIFAMSIAGIWYDIALFKPISGLSNKASTILYIFINILILIICTNSQLKTRRNWLSIIINIIIGFGCCSIIAYFNIYKATIIIVTVCTLVLMIVYIVALLVINASNRDKTGSIIKSRYNTISKVIQLILACSCSIVMCAIWLKAPPFIQLKENYSISFSNETIEGNIDALSTLNEDAWNRANTAEKQQALQAVVEIERCNLGIPFKIQLVIDDMNGPIGKYNHSSKTITINESMLGQLESWRIVNTVCHEVYHSYQRCLVDVFNSSSDNYKALQVFAKVKKYHEDFINYSCGEDDFSEYYDQTVEEDARTFGTSEADRFKFEIWRLKNQTDAQTTDDLT